MKDKEFSININDNNPHAFCIIHVELDSAEVPVDWTFVYCNDKMAELEKKSKSELIGKRYYRDILKREPSQRKWLIHYYESAYEGKPSEFENISSEIDRYLSIKTFPAGERGYCAVVLRDIQEEVFRKARMADELDKTVQQLKIEKEMLRQLMQEKNRALEKLNEALEATDMLHKSIGSGAWYFDYNRANELIGVRWSSAFRKLLGYEKESEFVDSPDSLRRSVHPDDRERVHRCYRAAVEDITDRTKCDVEFRCMTKERGYRWFRATASIKRRPDGSARTAFGIFIDIDDKKQVDDQLCEALDRAEKANQAKTAFLRHMSHDIRTPLNGISGLIELGNRHPEDVVLLQEERKKAKIAIKYLLSLINNVLDISKLEDGNDTAEDCAFDLVELLWEDVAVIKDQMLDLKLSYINDSEHTYIKHRHLIGNRQYLNHILMNLASNAVKFNRPNGTVKMCTEELSCDGDVATFRFVCADTGQGMSQEFQRRMFEPFAQEGKVTYTSYMGSGLGLSFVKSMVDQLGGTLECQSQEGVGTTFTVTLSFKVDKSHGERLAQEAAAESLIQEADLSGMKILVVEDNELNQEVARMLLDYEGAQVELAGNGREAVDKFAFSEPDYYDIIFMDIMMPVMNGLEASRKIRALNRPDAGKVVIIAMSANAFQDDVADCLAAGMDAHCAKPFDIAKLKRTIWQIQQKKRPSMH